MERVHLISLGCPKNRVDSEVMVGKLQAGPFESRAAASAACGALKGQACFVVAAK